MPSHLPKKRALGAQASGAAVTIPRVYEEVNNSSNKATVKSILGDTTNIQTVISGKSLKEATKSYVGQSGIEDDSEVNRNLYTNNQIPTHNSGHTTVVGRDDESLLNAHPGVKYDNPDNTLMELDTGMVESVSDPFNPIVHSIEEVDKHDVNMVAEYADEIIEYMRELEIRMMPDPCYIDRQPELKWHMRGILLDWLVQVHDRFKMHQETLFLCVNYIDRFLSVKEISIDKLQLVGITALFIAAKYEEISAPTISEMIFMVDGAFSVDDLKKAERYMMNILNYELGYPDPLSFLRRISKADRYDTAIRTLAKYLSEVTLMYETFIQYPSSKIAAASYYLAMGLINKGSWTSSHIHYSGYTEMDLMPCALQLRSRLPHKQNHEAVYIKYNSEKYMNASIFVEDVFANCI